MVAGAGWYGLAIVSTAVVFLALTGLRLVERGLLQRLAGQTLVLRCELPSDPETFWHLLTTLGDLRVRLLQVESLPSGDTDFQRVRLTLNVSGRVPPTELLHALTRAGAVSVKLEE